MKVIAITNNDSYSKTFLIEATDNEIAKIQGESYASRLPTIKIGQQFDVSKSFNDLARFRTAKGDLERAAEVLRATASMVDMASACYSTDSEPEEESK